MYKQAEFYYNKKANDFIGVVTNGHQMAGAREDIYQGPILA